MTWQLRRELIMATQHLRLALSRVSDAAQQGVDLPEELEGQLQRFLEVQHRYDEASRG